MKIGFIIWLILCVLFVLWGISCMKSKKPVGFWANCEKPKNIIDVKKYNQAVGKLFIVYAGVLCLLGLPMAFCEQNSPLVLLTVVGVAFSTIFVMIFYVLKIESKYVVK